MAVKHGIDGLSLGQPIGHVLSSTTVAITHVSESTHPEGRADTTVSAATNCQQPICPPKSATGYTLPPSILSPNRCTHKTARLYVAVSLVNFSRVIAVLLHHGEPAASGFRKGCDAS